MRQLNIGCFGGGTGLPSLLGGLKHNPWLHLHAVVTMFDSGGSSGQLRDELGVLPPGDILKCALALSRNAREARRVLLARLPTLEHARLGGHTGGNLLLSMMQRYSGDFLDAIDGLRALLGCRGRVWPVSVQSGVGLRRVRRRLGDARRGRSRCRADAPAGSCKRIWLEPPVSIHPTVAKAISEFDAVIIGPGSFYTSLMPIFLVRGVAEALAHMKGPVILIANLLTEGRGMMGFTAADAVARIEEAIQPPGRRRHHQHEVARRRKCSVATRRSTRSRSRRARCRITASWSAASSGPATSPGTIAGGSPMPCGRCCRGGCWRKPERVLESAAEAAP